MKKEYYTLSNELDEQEVGEDFSQIDIIQPSPQWLTSWSFPEENTNFTIKLSEKAIKTDFLKTASISASGFFISQKVKDVLEKFKLMKHKYYRATLKTKTENIQYYWIHFSEPEISHEIDYQNSLFFETKWTFKEKEINLSSYMEYEKLKKEKGTSFGVGIEKISFNSTYLKSLDLFTFLPLDNQIYISEKLKTAFENYKITGFRANKASDLIKVN